MSGSEGSRTHAPDHLQVPLGDLVVQHRGDQDVARALRAHDVDGGVGRGGAGPKIDIGGGERLGRGVGKARGEADTGRRREDQGHDALHGAPSEASRLICPSYGEMAERFPNEGVICRS